MKSERVRDFEHLRELAKAGAWVNPPCLLTCAMFSPCRASDVLALPSKERSLLLRHGVSTFSWDLELSRTARARKRAKKPKAGKK